MKARSLALIAGSGAALLLAGQVSARFLGITVESKQNEFGILTVSVFALFDNPGEDLFQAVAGTQNSPMVIQVVGGTFYNHPYRDIHPYAPDADLVAQFPSLAFDTFLTIGVRSVGPGGQPEDQLTVTPGFPPLTGSQIASFAAGWAVTPDQPQGDPFDPVNCFPGDGRVLIGQFTTTKVHAAISGTMLLLVPDQACVNDISVTGGGSDLAAVRPLPALASR